MKRKFFLASMAMALTVPAAVAMVPKEAEASSFSDLNKIDSLDRHKIELLVGIGVINGFKDGTFRPTAKVTRGQYASFIANALGLPALKTSFFFLDVTKSVATYNGIVRAYDAGIISGYPDGRFRPNDEISRSDMAIMLDNALQYNGSFKEKAVLPYRDAGSIGARAYESLQRVTKYGIMKPDANMAFNPDVRGNRLETVLSIYELIETKGLWHIDRVKETKEPSGSMNNGRPDISHLLPTSRETIVPVEIDTSLQEPEKEPLFKVK